MKPSCLHDLPNELLREIFGYLPCNFRLASVTRVCQHFKDLIDSMGLKSLDLKVTIPENEIPKIEKSTRKKHSLHMLLRTSPEQPLGQTRTSWLPPSYDRFCRLFEHLDQHPKMLKEIRSVTLTVQDRSWYTLCFQHNGLLDSLPDLEHLTLSPPPPFSTSFPVQISNHGPRALRSLRLDLLPVSAEWYRIDVSDNILKVINHHLYWLGLRKLRIDGLDFVGVNFVNGGMTSIKDLWCVGCRNSETAAMSTQLMRSSTGLVRYVFETNINHRRGALPLSIPPFSFYDDGLLMHKRTLRQLVIASSDNGVIDNGWRLGPLDTFCQLEKLALPFFMISKPTLDKTNYEMLAPTLEELQVEYSFGCKFDDEYTLEIARSQVGQMKSQLSYLKRVILWEQWDPVQMAERNGGILDDASLKTIRVLEQAHEEVDVKFEWVAVSSFWDTPVGEALDAEGDVIVE